MGLRAANDSPPMQQEFWSVESRMDRRRAEVGHREYSQAELVIELSVT